jgi:Nuclease-related domain
MPPAWPRCEVCCLPTPRATAIWGRREGSGDRVVKEPGRQADPLIMRLKAWEIAVASAAGAFAAVFLFSNVSGLGFGILAADVLWVSTRIEILENHDVPGHYTTLRGRLGILKLGLLLGLNAAAIYAIVFIEHDVGARARATFVADFAIIGLCFMLLAEFRRSGDAAINWLVGARAEREVGGRLAVFKTRGWLVLHGYQRERGDIDHILCGPRGAFAIETKSYGYRPSDVGQVARNAAWLRDQLQNKWVTGVLCVDDDRPPWRKEQIWVVSHHDLVHWLEGYRDAAIDPEEARARLLPDGNARPAGWWAEMRSRLLMRSPESASG